MKAFGYIRFSYFGRSDVRMSRIKGEAEQDYFNKLFAPERMALRFHLFEHICLPSLRAQTDQDFTIYLLASKSMPQNYKAHLERLIASDKQIQIVYEDAENVVTALDSTIEDIRQNSDGNSLHFRMDDDDAIGMTVIENLKALAAHAEVGTILSLPRGFHLLHGETGTQIFPKHNDFIGIAFGFVGGPERIRNPYASSHFKAHHKAPARLDPRLYSYIHVSHPASDTLGMQARFLKKLTANNPDHDSQQFKERVAQDLGKAFPFTSVEGLQKIMKAIPSEIGD